VSRVVEHASTEAARDRSEARLVRDVGQLRGLAGKVGNRRMGALLQRYRVAPMPIIYRQFLMWRHGAHVLDLNCGWYSQLAVVDHFYVANIRNQLTAAQQQQLEGGSAPHLSYSAGRALLPYANKWVFSDFGFDPSAGGPGAIATGLALPAAPAGGGGPSLRRQWKNLLQAHGPLIVSGRFGEPFGVPHYVTVVAVENDRMYYLDALAFKVTGDRGTLRHQRFNTMAAKVRSIDYVAPAAINALFAPYVQAANAAAAAAANAPAAVAADSSSDDSSSESSSDSDD
jgi:hypothetical protein